MEAIQGGPLRAVIQSGVMRHNVRAVRLRVGRNVKYLRRLRGLSQERLAERVGNTYKHIGQVERGEVNVTIDILIAIAASLSVNAGDLFTTAADNAAGPRTYMITQRDFEQMEQALRVVERVKHATRRRAASD